MMLINIIIRYHDLYMRSKGNVFKNKRVLIETIHKEKNEASREKVITEQAEARRLKNKNIREKKAPKKNVPKSIGKK